MFAGIGDGWLCDRPCIHEWTFGFAIGLSLSFCIKKLDKQTCEISNLSSNMSLSISHSTGHHVFE